jgi:hypothetical protein
MNVRTGWVGFFDILGYANLLQRNEPELIAEEVVPLLTSCTKPEVINWIDSFLEKLRIRNFEDSFTNPQSRAQFFGKFLDDLNLLLFSDTILITMPTDRCKDVESNPRFLIFYVACEILQFKLFRAGLPLRGAIDFGRFFVHDTFFAGHPIVNAYELCNGLELAACVVSKAAYDQMQGLKGFGRGSDLFVSEYLVPTKNGERHFFVTRSFVYEKNVDIRQQVMNAFWAHRKDITIDAQKKALNTEQWLRYLEHVKEKEAAEEKPTTDVLLPPADA